LSAAGTINRSEVIENKIQDLAWTIGAGHFGRTIEAVELEFDAMGRIGIVSPHPLDEFSIRVEPAEAVAKSTFLHRLIRCRAATGHVLVRDARPRKTALDGDGAVAMRLHQALKELVAEDENVLSAVERLSKTKQFHCIAKGGDHLIDGGIECFAR